MDFLRPIFRGLLLLALLAGTSLIRPLVAQDDGTLDLSAERLDRQHCPVFGILIRSDPHRSYLSASSRCRTRHETA